MNKITTKLVLGCILLFHIIITVHSFYVMFTDFDGWTIEHAHPFALLLFTLCWLGVFFQKRIFALLYFSLIFAELMMKLFFGQSKFGDVFGGVFFPIPPAFFVYRIIFVQTNF